MARREPEPRDHARSGLGLVGTLIGSEVIHLLLGRPVATEGRALILDLRTLDSRWEAVERLPGCPGCNHASGDG